MSVIPVRQPPGRPRPARRPARHRPRDGVDRRHDVDLVGAGRDRRRDSSAATARYRRRRPGSWRRWRAGRCSRQARPGPPASCRRRCRRPPCRLLGARRQAPRSRPLVSPPLRLVRSISPMARRASAAGRRGPGSLDQVGEVRRGTGDLRQGRRQQAPRRRGAGGRGQGVGMAERFPRQTGREIGHHRQRRHLEPERAGRRSSRARSTCRRGRRPARGQARISAGVSKLGP